VAGLLGLARGRVVGGLLGEVGEDPRVLERAVVALERRDRLLEELLLAEDLLGRLAPFPEGGIGREVLELLGAPLLAYDVKDASRARRASPSARRGTSSRP
jgi:hypothetical protein